MGGYLGVMAKLGPFCRRDNCSVVGGVGKVDNPLVGVVCTCMTGAGGWEPGYWVGICCAIVSSASRPVPLQLVVN